MIRHSLALTPLSAIAIILAAPALAQDASTDEAGKASDEEVIVTAARTALPPSALPLRMRSTSRSRSPDR